MGIRYLCCVIDGDEIKLFYPECLISVSLAST